VTKEIVQGELVQVLPGFTSPRPGFSLYYPKALRQLAVLRRFIEHFRAE
jgi:DNA-binding transcriptional LysR family regulator